MLDAAFMLGAGFIGGMMGGGLITALVLASFRRRCTSLEWAIGDLQDRASTFKGRDMAKKRWDKEDQFKAEMEQVMHTEAPRSRKYDNDPLGTL